MRIRPFFQSALMLSVASGIYISSTYKTEAMQGVETEEGIYYPEAKLFIPYPPVQYMDGSPSDNTANLPTSPNSNINKIETTPPPKAPAKTNSTGNTQINVAPKIEVKPAKETPAPKAVKSETETKTVIKEETATKAETPSGDTSIKQSSESEPYKTEYYDESKTKPYKKKSYSNDQNDQYLSKAASDARLSSKNKAKQLLQNNSVDHYQKNGDHQSNMMSDQPKKVIDTTKTNKLSASIGQFLSSGNDGENASSPAPQPICLAPDVADELQEQLDEEKKQLKKALQKAKKKLQKRLKKLKKQKELDAKNKAREKMKDAKKKLDKKGKELQDEADRIREKQEARKEQKEKAEDDYDKARKKEYELRKKGDPNCRSAACKAEQTKQTKLRKALTELEKSQVPFEKEVQKFQKQVKDYKNSQAAFENALDRGKGLTKDQWKARMYEKQKAQIEAEYQKMSDRHDREVAEREQYWREKAQRKKGWTPDSDDNYDDNIDPKTGKYLDPRRQKLHEKQTREISRLTEMRDKAEKLYEDQQNVLSEKGLPTMEETLDYFSNSDLYDREISAIESSLEHLEAAENRIQNFVGQPDMNSAKDLIKQQQQAEANLDKISKEAAENMKKRPKTPTQKERKAEQKKLRDAKRKLSQLQSDPSATWKDKEAAKKEVAKAEKTYDDFLNKQKKFDYEHSKKYGDALQKAHQDARIAGLGAIGPHAQEIVSDYNRGLPDVFGPDGKVDTIKVNNIAKQLDQQLMDMARINAEVSGLNQVRGNLVGKDGKKSLAEQAGMSPKAVKARLSGIDQRLGQARQYQEKLQGSLGLFGFKSKINEAGTCQIESVSSTFGAAYVTSAKRAQEEKKKGKASPAADKVAKNAQNAKNASQAKQAEQFKMKGGSGQCAGAGAPVASCGKTTKQQRGVQMAGKFTRMAGAIAGGIGGAVAATTNEALGFAVNLEEYLEIYGEVDTNEYLTSVKRKKALDNKIAGYDELLKTALKGGEEEELISKLKLEAVTERDRLKGTIAKLERNVNIAALNANKEKSSERPISEPTKEIAKVSTAETAQSYKTAIGSLVKEIENIERVMSTAETASVPGLLPALNAQREGLFAAVYALQAQLEEVRVKKPKAEKAVKTAERLPEEGSKRAELIKARNTINDTIIELAKSSAGFSKSGLFNEANALKAQIAGLESSREAIDNQLKLPENALSAPEVSPFQNTKLDKAVSDQKLLKAVSALQTNIENAKASEQVFSEAGLPYVAQAFTNQRMALEAAKLNLLERITVAPNGPAVLGKAALLKTSLHKKEQRKSVEQIELERTASLVNWINEGFLPAFKKSDASKALLPTLLTGLIKRFGASVADEIIDDVLKKMEAYGEEPSAALFIDELLKQINDQERAKNTAEQNLLADRARAQFLKEMLQNKNKQLDENQLDLLQESLDKLKPQLLKIVEKQLAGLDNKPIELLKVLTSVGEILALPSSEQTDIKPFLSQISRQLARLEKSGKIASDENARKAAGNLKVSLSSLFKSLPKTSEGSARSREVSDLLVRVNKQLAAAYLANAKGENAEQAKQQYELSRLDQARHTLRNGNFKDALEIINSVKETNPTLKLAKALAIINTLNTLEGSYGVLAEEERQKLGKFETLLLQRDAAIATILETSKNPKLISMLLLGNAERLRKKGEISEAISVIETALKKNPGDEVLTGTKLKLEILQLGDKATAEDISKLLSELPEKEQLKSGLLALNNFTVEGNRKLAAVLVEVLKNLKNIPEDQKEFADIQIDYAEISNLAAGLGVDTDANLLARKLNFLKLKVKKAKGLDEKYARAITKASDELLELVLKGQKWAERAKSNTIPLDKLLNLTRESMAAGRYDITGPAMVNLMKRLLKESGSQKVLSGFKHTTRLLDQVRMRLAAGGLTKEQETIFRNFLKTYGGQVHKLLDTYAKERAATVAKSSLEAGRNKLEGKDLESVKRSHQGIFFELRQLGQLKARLALLEIPPNQRLAKLKEAFSKASTDVTNFENQIKEDFDERGTLLRDHVRDKSYLQESIGTLNSLRAIRDGIEDYYFENAGQYVAPDEIFGVKYGSFRAKSHREWAMKVVHKKLAGIYAYASSAKEVWDRRKDNKTSGRGLREKMLAKDYWEPKQREYDANKEKYKNFWLQRTLDRAEMEYLDQRRVQLINEDSSRSIPERAKLFKFFVEAEAKYLEALVGSTNPLVVMFEKVGSGYLMKGEAAKLRSRIAINDKNQLINEYQNAYQEKDAQRLFRALVNLREASLAGEFKAFVSYLHKDWYEVGPGWFYNRSVGEEATQEALEQITVETQKVQQALIRASYNLPSQLNEADQRILQRHGFLKDNKYTIPEQIKWDPTKVVSEFTALTETGALATLDRFVNAKMAAELFATVAVPGAIAGKFGKAVTMELLALGGIRSLSGKAIAYGSGLLAEGAAFTLLSRGARVGMDPAMLMQDDFWSLEGLGKEYLHNLMIIGALKGFGKTSQEVSKRLSKLGTTSAKAASLGRAAGYVALMGEAGLLTGLNGLMESNKITQDEYLGNLLTIVLLKGTNKALHGGEKSGSQRLQEARINKILSYMGKPPVPGTTPLTKVSQLREAQIREIEYRDWLQNVDKPTKLLMEKYDGNWDAARKDYQKGKLSEYDMRKLVNLRRHIIDTLANEIIAEVGGKFEAFGSENLTSDYDISFVGPNRALATYLFNARFASRWGVASRVGGRETGIIFDTNAYTETIQSLIRAGKGDTTFQDAYAHLAKRKYSTDAEWAAHRKLVLENTPEKFREQVSKVLDFVEAANLEYKTAVELKMAELSQNKENPVRESDLKITAENRLYEQTLFEISKLQRAFEKASGEAKEALRLQLRNAQSKALYYAQEAYHTQAAIEHVVMSIQAAGRKITVESLTSDTPPKLKVELTQAQGRQSYFEQIANMMKELSHKGNDIKLATKGAKYFIRALDAAQIAGIKLGKYKELIEQVVELDANRANLEKVTELIIERKLKQAEREKGSKLTEAEKQALAEQGAKEFLSEIQKLANQLTAELYSGQALEVVDLTGVRQITAETKAMNTRDIINNIDRPTQVLLERFNGDWAAARSAYQKGKLSATEMRLLFNLRKRLVDSLAAEIIRRYGGEVQAFGSENLTSDYDISFVGPKAQLAVIEFNALFAAGWGMASKLGGRETGVVLDTNAYTETIQSLIKAGKGDIAFQDAFAHLAGRKYLSEPAWQAHRKLILENTPVEKRAEVEKILSWAEKSNKEFREAIEAKKAELRADENLNIRESDVQITAENRLYEAALKEIYELRQEFETATGEAKENLRQKLRNAQSKALYFAQEAYHTQGAIEHVVMSIQAAGRKITIESLLSDTPPELKVKITAEQGRQSYFEQVANMMKEISHGGESVKLASKGAKYFVRALDAAQIAGVKLANFKTIVEMTVLLNNNRANLEKVSELLAKEALDAARKEKGRELTEAEQNKIINETAEKYLSDLQKAANQLTGELYKGKTVEVADSAGVEKISLDLPKPANDNVKVEVASAKEPAAEVPTPRPNPNTVEAQKSFKFTDTNGVTRDLVLGEYIGSGSTSMVYRHVANDNLVVRITKLAEWDARRLDEFGRNVLENIVDTRFLRVATRVATVDVHATFTNFFRVRNVESVELVERMKQGTAEDIMAKQGGQLTKGQRFALDQAIRELNRKGFAWLDNKTDNYTFERVAENMDVWRVVVIDPGAIVPVHGATPYAKYVTARNLQARIGQLTPDMIDMLTQFENAGRKFVAAEIRGTITNEHRLDVNTNELGVPFREIAYSPVGMFRLPVVREMFALDNATANDNYDKFIEQQMASAQ